MFIDNLMNDYLPVIVPDVILETEFIESFNDKCEYCLKDIKPDDYFTYNEKTFCCKDCADGYQDEEEREEIEKLIKEESKNVNIKN